MVHRIDAEHDQEGGRSVVSLRPRPGAAPHAARIQPAAEPVSPRETPKVARKPLWDKNNFGFWLVVCILVSLLFSIVYRALG